MEKSEAIQAVEAAYGPLPSGDRYVARTTESDFLWSVHASDSNGMPYAGGSYLVGPDARVWSISSNSGIHDRALAVQSISALYDAGVSDRVNDEQYQGWLRSESERRSAVIPELVAEAIGGSLMGKRTRRLP